MGFRVPNARNLFCERFSIKIQSLREFCNPFTKDNKNKNYPPPPYGGKCTPAHEHASEAIVARCVVLQQSLTSTLLRGFVVCLVLSFPGMSFSRLDEFARGEISGMGKAGFTAGDIAKKVYKGDGKHPTKRAVATVLKNLKKNPKWRGKNSSAGGRPSKLSDAVRKKLYNLVLKNRGSAVVTVKFCQKALPALRKVSATTVSRALHDAGLAWLRRRRKQWVPKEHKEARKKYAKWLLGKNLQTFKKFAFVDGTTFYLARTDDEAAQQERRRLGAHVWRMSTGKDGLFDDNVGPSLYAASQGRPVKVWGYFANGKLQYHVLPLVQKKPKKGAKKVAAKKKKAKKEKTTSNMNGARYQKMAKDLFPRWATKCWGRAKPARVLLVQDHERCLWAESSLRAAKDAGCDVVKNFPKSSPDLNHVENVWAFLRQKLEGNAPTGRETRGQFLRRLSRTVAGINKSKALLGLWANHKERAAEVLKLKGAKTSW